MSVPNLPSTRTTVPSMGCGYIVCLVLGLGGLGLLYVAQTRVAERREADAWISGILGGALTIGALSLIAPMQREVARVKERVRREEAQPGEPWTWDPRWTEPNGIPQSGRRNATALTVFAIVALVISSPAVFAIESEIRKGNLLIWVALIFPAVGVMLLAMAANDAWRRRKYGTARFVPAGIPVALGTGLSGMVIVSRPVIANGAGRIALDCWTTRISRGRKRNRQDEVVAHTEREIAASDWNHSAGESRLFVQLPVRGGQATTMGSVDADNPGFEWRLRVETPTEGADFVAEFVLPVFEVADAVAAAGADVARVIPARKRGEVFRAAGIQELSQPGASGEMALQFAAGTGRRLVTAPLVMTLVFGAMSVGLWMSSVPGVIAFFVSFFALLPALIVKSLWSGGGEKVWIESGDVCVQRGSRSPLRIPVTDILTIESNKNVGVGAQQFYRIVARRRPKQERHVPKRTDIATMVQGDEAAAEVIAWIEERMTARAM